MHTKFNSRQRGILQPQVLVATGDTASLVTAAGSLMGALPATAAILSIIWAVLRIVLTCLRIGENKLFLKHWARIKNKLRGK